MFLPHSSLFVPLPNTADYRATCENPLAFSKALCYLSDMNTRSLERLVLEGSGRSFPGGDARLMIKPCVYLFLRDGVPLYIGMSKNGISRAFSPSHRQAKEARQECDEMRVWFCDNTSKAMELERLLIGRLRPKYNTQDNRQFRLQVNMSAHRFGLVFYTRPPAKGWPIT